MKTRRFRVTTFIELPFNYNKHWTEDKLAAHIEKLLKDDKLLETRDVYVEADKEPLIDIHNDPSEEDICSFAWPAGYVAPDGKFYGMESKDCGLCHLSLSNEIYEYYSSIIDFKQSSKTTIEGMLEDMGFIKIHGLDIYYWFYLYDKPKYWTDEQIDTIYRYMKHVEETHKTCVRFYGYGPVKAHEFRQMDKVAIMQKFSD